MQRILVSLFFVSLLSLVMSKVRGIDNPLSGDGGGAQFRAVRELRNRLKGMPHHPLEELRPVNVRPASARSFGWKGKHSCE